MTSRKIKKKVYISDCESTESESEDSSDLESEDSSYLESEDSSDLESEDSSDLESEDSSDLESEDSSDLESEDYQERISKHISVLNIGVIKCSRCKKESCKSYFMGNKNGTLYKTCLSCRNNYKKHYRNNIEKYKEKSKTFSKNNREVRNKMTQNWRNKNKEKSKECNRRNRAKNRCKHDKYKRECKTCSPVTHLAIIVRSAVRAALKGNKSQRSVQYLGCTIKEYKVYIEAKLEQWMTWANHGEWHIDHITPLLYKNPTLKELKKRLHYTNTQPLEAKENISKGNRRIMVNKKCKDYNTK
jgi:hypothetical protein